MLLIAQNKRLDALITTQKKTELILMDHFGIKILLTIRGIQNIFLTFLLFFQICSKILHQTGPVSFAFCDSIYIIYYFKKVIKILSVEKNWQKVKRVQFLLDPSDGQVFFLYIAMISVFLRSNQCIKTLILSYRTIFLIFHQKGWPFWLRGSKNMHMTSRASSSKPKSYISIV